MIEVNTERQPLRAGSYDADVEDRGTPNRESIPEFSSTSRRDVAM